MRTELTSEIEVWMFALALPLVLLVAWVFGSIARWLLRGRVQLGTSTSIVISVLGTAAGLFAAGLLDPTVKLWSLLTVSLGLGFSTGGIALYALVAAHFQRPQRASIAEMLSAGESDRVEFKSTARVNLHTGTKDDRMEQVIAKTVCAFLNSDGGTLLIGVDDAGVPLGLAADFATLKSPDADRFELWLRDLLSTCLGQNAAGLVSVEFAQLPDADQQVVAVCRLTCVPSPRPVYLRAKGGHADFWVRSGNSTRLLGVDQAAEYVMHRWPLGFGPAIGAQLAAAVRFSERH